SVFPKPTIRDLMSQYTLVQLYTDTVPPQYQPTTTPDENKQLALRFGSIQLPYYVILRPLAAGKYEVVSRYSEGKINNIDGFAEFLRSPLDAGGRIASAAR